MIEKAYTQEGVAERFQKFLAAHGLRQTKERFAILHAVYDIEGIFTIEDLQQVMDMQRFRVSTATLYSTTLLLVQANLLIRHPFSSTVGVFERIADEKPRNYQVCNNCHHITRIKSKELASSLENYHTRSFHITHRIVYVYGICVSCQLQARKQLKIHQQLSENKPKKHSKK
jgi:Fur family ferric uptake transcriptional regulator